MHLGVSRRNVVLSARQKSPRHPLKRRRLAFDCLEDRRLLTAGTLAPSGSEFLVNTTTAGTQTMTTLTRAVAMDGSGNSTVVWLSQPGGSGANWNVVFQRFDASDMPLGTETVVATSASQPTVAAARSRNTGDFVVTWTVPSAQNNISVGSTYAELFDPNGNALSGALLVGGSGDHYLNSVAMDDAGDFDVLYAAYKISGPYVTGPALTLQRYDASAVAQGKPITVANVSLQNGARSVALDSVGDAVVVWDDAVRSNGSWVYTVNAQRYTSSGKAAGGVIQVNPSTAALQWQSDVGMDSAGDFVVAWEHRTSDSTSDLLLARVFNANGTPRTGQLQEATNAVEEPVAVAVTPSGPFTLAWTSNINASSEAGPGVNGYDIYADSFDASGNPLQPAFQVNTTIAGDQQYASAATDTAGDVLIVWSGNGVGDTSGVFGQRYVDPPAVTSSTTTSSSTGATSSSGSTAAATDAVFTSYAYPEDDETVG